MMQLTITTTIIVVVRIIITAIVAYTATIIGTIIKIIIIRIVVVVVVRQSLGNRMIVVATDPVDRQVARVPGERGQRLQFGKTRIDGRVVAAAEQQVVQRVNGALLHLRVAGR